MICPECGKARLQSRVYIGVSSTTLAYSPPFYDEEGRYHDHDPNIRTTQYECSNGHQWAETTRPSCWCGWPEHQGS